MQTKRLNASIRKLLEITGLAAYAFVFWQSPLSAQTTLPPDNAAALPKGADSSSGGNSFPANVQTSDSTVVTIDPNQLVLRAVHQAVFGPPIACKVRQESRAFNQQVAVSGEYKASGGGTGQFRYNARVSSGETTVDTIQVSDGRLMYTQVGIDEPPRRVIIDQVRQSLGGALNHANDHPDVSMHLAIGGHPELLRNLYHRYLWYKVKGGNLGGVDVWQLVGKLRTERPKVSGTSELDTKSLEPPPPESKLPEIVRLTLGRSTSMAYFPYMVEYYRRTATPDDPPEKLELVSKLWHPDATTSVTLSEKDFVYRVQESVGRIDDETSLYMPSPEIAKLPFSQFK